MSGTHSAGAGPRLITGDALERARRLRDLSDPAGGPHAMQLVLDRITHALADAWRCALHVHRADPVVSTADNYDALHYPPGAAARDARYARYVTADTLLRTHTTAMVPPLLRALAEAERAHGTDDRPHADVLLVCPGLVYRRDTIDRLHTGEPQQADLWRVRAGPPLGTADLRGMIRSLAGAILPSAEYRCTPVEHPYTTDGLQVDVLVEDEWVEIGECGIALPALLEECGLDPRRWSGLAMGIGLDRLLMLVKRIPDIRLLRSTDPRVTRQMLDLEPWRPVSNQPPIRRDLSIAVAEDRAPEEIGDRVREAMRDALGMLESVEVLGETPGMSLPAAARRRIGLRPGQKNVLIRLVIRDLDRTLTSTEANVLRDRVYAAVHEGDAWQWASRPV